VLSQVLEDVHDFRDANRVWTSDWVLQVTDRKLVVLKHYKIQLSELVVLKH
jgi:hypothetical protein